MRALERLRLDRPRVRQDPFADLVGQVEPTRDPVRLFVVPEAQPEPRPQRRIERVLARVAERRVAQIVPQPDRLGQILVQRERSGDHARDRRRLQRMRHPRAVVVALRVDEDLRLPLQPAERLRVHDPVPVALKRRAHRRRLLVALSPSRLVRPDRQRREPRVFLLAHASLEGITDSPGQLGHPSQTSRWRGANRLSQWPQLVSRSPTQGGEPSRRPQGRRYRSLCGARVSTVRRFRANTPAAGV